MTKSNRRNFLKSSVAFASGVGSGLGFTENLFASTGISSIQKNETKSNKGVQRLPIERLKEWETLQYGMFIHFGMSTFSGEELGTGKDPNSLYNPTKLDVDQWVQVARDAGMRYLVLTTKHVSGHCLWPSKFTDYHVGNSGNKTDVVEAFVKACDKYGMIPGFYYCSWDNHHLFGSATPSNVAWENKFTTAEYCEFQRNQVEELLTQYGKIGEMWIDIPGMLSHEERQAQYNQIAKLQPNTLIMMNGGVGKNHQIRTDYSWPTDLVSMERSLPPSRDGFNPWFTVKNYKGEDEDFYIPGEVCDTLCYTWFWKEENQLRSADEVLGMRLISKERGANFLLNVPPDKTGRIPQKLVDVLMDCDKKYSTLKNS